MENSKLLGFLIKFDPTPRALYANEALGFVSPSFVFSYFHNSGCVDLLRHSNF